MTDLETRLHRVASALDTAVERYHDDDDVYVKRPATSRRRSPVVGVAVLVAAAAAVGAVILGGKSTPTEQAAGSNALLPAATLPHNDDSSDSPAVVLGDQPHLWYRLQADLEVTWYTDGQGAPSGSMLCWRTPVKGQCVPGVYKSGPLPLIIPTAGGQTLIITSGGPSTTTLDIRLSDGEELSAPIAWDTTLNWGVARYDLPSSAVIAAIGTVLIQNADSSAVTGATLPPAINQQGPASTLPTSDRASP